MADTTSSSNLQSAYGLDGKLALITGGGTGIGLAIASCLRAVGARVVLAGRRENILAVAAKSLGDDVAWEQVDLADIAQLAEQEERIAARHGAIDILVNNAGNTVKKPFDFSNMADFDEVFDVHVRGALELTRRVIARQIAGNGGSVIFTSSMTAFIGQPMVLGYTVAKTAISGVVRGLSAEFAARGVRVNAVAPGWIDTDLYRKATAGDIPRQQKILSRIPMGALGKPEDIGWACAFLASPAAQYVTGQVLLVDGGWATGF